MRTYLKVLIGLLVVVTMSWAALKIDIHMKSDKIIQLLLADAITRLATPPLLICYERKPYVQLGEIVYEYDGFSCAKTQSL